MSSVPLRNSDLSSGIALTPRSSTYTPSSPTRQEANGGRGAAKKQQPAKTPAGGRRSVPVVVVPPDFLKIEFCSAAKINGDVFLGHAELRIVGKRLIGSAVVLNVLQAELQDNQICVVLFGRTPIPIILMARVGARQAVLRAEEIDGAGFAVIAG